MKKPFPQCDLCRQPVKLAGFSLFAGGGTKRFCCEGCLRIYRLLESELVLTQPLEKTT